MSSVKINIYLLVQIFKYFFLILFIFLSISLLIQVTRLFTITNFVNIEILDIFFLSLYLIPNIITVITPFIIIFVLLLCFLKLNKDNELLAIFSLGFGLSPFKSVFILFSAIILSIFSFLNFYLAPKIYEQYKINEYDLRNTLDLNKMEFSNFLNLNNTTILDFNKNENIYEDIFISFKDKKENLIYAKKGNIFSENNQYSFQLTNGFKISIDANQQIEKLEFLNYILKIENKNINIGEIIDKNTYTIFDDYKSKNYLNIIFKIVDILLILYVIYFFYFNNIKNIKFDINNNIFFSILCISVLIINQILKNSDVLLYNYIILIFIVITIAITISYFKKIYE